jgi:glycosyltransferase involved in cell wall biosynthesis
MDASPSHPTPSPATTERRQSMRILLLSHVANDRDGGASRIYHLLTDALRSRGHQVELQHLEDVAGLPEHPQLRKLAQRVVMPQLLSRHAGSLQPTTYDVVMASSGMAHPLFRRLSADPARPLLVNHVHGLAVYDHVARLVEDALGHGRASAVNRAITGPFQKRWDDAGIRTADVTVVQNLRDLGAVRVQEVAGPARACMIPAAVHPTLLEASGRCAPVESRPAGNLVWFATWEARKGAPYLPAALHAVRRRHPDVQLTIGGTGLPPEVILDEFAHEDRSAVRVLPRISMQEQIRLLDAGSIFVFPSLSEGFGLALVEAMAFGLGAVTTTTGFGGDFVQDGVNGRVIAPTSEHLARALLELIEHPERRIRIGRAGRELARSFTAERMVDAYEQLFLTSIPSGTRERAVA